jgi:hypothetical protein
MSRAPSHLMDDLHVVEMPRSRQALRAGARATGVRVARGPSWACAAAMIRALLCLAGWVVGT